VATDIFQCGLSGAVVVGHREPSPSRALSDDTLETKSVAQNRRLTKVSNLLGTKEWRGRTVPDTVSEIESEWP
jgi:hypothetical protein